MIDDDPDARYARPCESRLPGIERIVNSIVIYGGGNGAGVVVDEKRTVLQRKEVAAEISALLYDTDGRLYHGRFNGDGAVRFKAWKGEKLKPLSEDDYISTNRAAAAYLGVDANILKKLGEHGWLHKKIKNSLDAFSLKELNDVFGRVRAGKRIYPKKGALKEQQKQQYKSAVQHYLS